MLIKATDKTQASFLKSHKLIFGKSFSGKTWFSQFLGVDGKPVIYISTEDGQIAFVHHKIRITSWNGFVKALKSVLEMNKAKLVEEHGAIVIDLTNELDQWCVEWVCKMAGVDSLGEVPHGAGFSKHNAEFRNKISKVLNLGLPVVFIAHTREVPDDKIIVNKLDMTNRTALYLSGKCDIKGFVMPENAKGERKISFRATKNWDGGSRLQGISKDYVLDVDGYKTVAIIEEDIKGAM